MKKLTVLIGFFILQSVLLYADENQKTTCPPRCNGLSANIFFDNFCCEKKEETKLDCEFFEPGGEKCCNTQHVIVSYWDPAQYTPWDPIAEAKESAQKFKESFYICPITEKRALSWKYYMETASFSVTVFDANSKVGLFLDSHLETDLKPNDPLVQEAKQNLFNYLCTEFNAKEFFHTQKAPPFRTTYKKRTQSAAGAQAGEKAAKQQGKTTDKKRKRKEPATETSDGLAVAEVNPSAETEQPPADGPLTIANIVFYPVPVPDNLPTVRHFRTANKLQELKINFSSGDKSVFLQKLMKQFPPDSYALRYCENNNIFFETKQDVYQAFILTPEAVIVFARPVTWPVRQELRQALCLFEPQQPW